MNLQHIYKTVREASLKMVEPLETEDFIPQPTYFASPPKWNLGHTTWFFEDMILKRFVPNYKAFHPQYSFVFNSYYNSMGDRVARNHRGDLSRPTVREVMQYREYVDAQMLKLLANITNNLSLNQLVQLGLNHEQQHQELFYTDLKYTFSVNPLFPAYSENAMVEDSDGHDFGFTIIKEGLYNIGYDGGDFFYDNEGPKHTFFLHAYEIRKKLVTNGEYIEFINSGGYTNKALWHDEALKWLDDETIYQPIYWHKKDNEWFQFTLAGLRKVDPNHILTHISYYEAYAFAQWKGMRLPTEFEWEVASKHITWGLRWEWTESAYLPYPGYKREAGALGEYNGKFMVNQKVLRGASVVTPKGHERDTYRNFFHPNMAYQFNGIRLAK